MTTTTRGMRSARFMVGVAGAVTAALFLAACGSAEPAASPGGGGSGATSGEQVSTRDLDGVGKVLVDNAGKTLYFTDSDKASDIRCTAECLKFWVPATAPGDTIDGASVGDLSVVTRPDGAKQIAYQDKPLYTFTGDSTDKPASGNNLTDTFDGVEFTWHVAMVGGGSGGEQPAPPGGGYGGGGGY